MVQQYGLWINGEWKKATETMEVLNKYHQEVFAKVARASKEDVEKAVSSAEQAFHRHALSPYERFEILNQVSELLKERKEEFARVITAEAGKPIKQARGEIDRAVQTLKISAEEAKRIHGEGIPVEASPGAENRMAFTIRVPVGVVGAISPFNFPVNLVCHKIGPALAAGNAVVLKPASTTPVSSLKLAELFHEAGLPAGLLNVVTGSGSTVGQYLMDDERIQLYTFTGSAEVGLKLKQQTGMNKLILELGNNSPVIVDEEADLKKAARTTAIQSFAFAGQVCISVQRLYVHENIFNEFTTEFIEATKELHVGDPYDDRTDVGPMISEKEAMRAEEWIEEAKKEGATVLFGGKRDGALFEPTVLTHVKKDMQVVCQEIFAPVVTFIPYRDLDVCIKEINESNYGLQGGIFTKNIDKAFYAARKIDVGGMMINDGSQFRVDLMPYGGIKNSGWGKEGPKYSIEEMTHEKLIVLNL